MSATAPSAADPKQSIRVATFYKFASLPDCRRLQTTLQAQCRALGIRGTILLAEEGINATIAGAPAAIETVLQQLRANPRLADLTAKESTASEPPFRRLKVKVKPEIVTFGAPESDPTQRVGRYVAPEQWNRLIQDPDVVLVDTRNDFEVRLGTFEGAENPATTRFRDFRDYVRDELAPREPRKVAMFCTGGIRCEKATSYLLANGFDEVYHLEGGILAYLERIPEADSLWRGACFVFDERVALGHGLRPMDYPLCSNCGNPRSATPNDDTLCAECVQK